MRGEKEIPVLFEEAEIKDVKELIRYYENNKEDLLPYQVQGLELPGNPEGLEGKIQGERKKLLVMAGF